MIENDTSDAGVEDLIAWHQDCAAWYGQQRVMPGGQSESALHRLKCRHETTAELLAELLEWRDENDDDD